MKKKPEPIPADCMPRCGSCAFFKDEDCRRYPPTVIVGAEGIGTCYPGVDESDWCGEYVRALQS